MAEEKKPQEAGKKEPKETKEKVAPAKKPAATPPGDKTQVVQLPKKDAAKAPKKAAAEAPKKAKAPAEKDDAKNLSKTLTHTLQLNVTKQIERVQQGKKKADTMLLHYVKSAQRADNATAYEAVGFSVTAGVLFNAFGQTLYRIGEQTEYTLLVAWRTLRWLWKNTFGYLLALLWRVLCSVFQGITAVVGTSLYELTLPLRQFFIGLKYVQKRKKGTSVWQYMRLLIKANHAAAKRASMYLLPLAAALVTVLTITSTLHSNYALSVTYNDELIGFVQNETVWDGAVSLVQERLERTGSTQRFTAMPDLRLTVCDPAAMVGTSAMADIIVSKSADEIQQATGIRINDQLVGVTGDGKALQALLDSLLAQYGEPDNPNMRTEFSNSVELQNGVYYTSSVLSMEALKERLGIADGIGRQVYTAAAGDTENSIAAMFGISVEELQSLNPQMQADGYKLAAGNKLFVSNTSNLLQVQTVETVQYEAEVPYETITQESDEYVQGSTRTTQQGVNGTANVTAEITRIDGVEVDTTVIASEPIVEMVPRIVVKGTKQPTIVGSTGSGMFMNPVPNYTRSGTYAGHRGWDIMAPYGTPIYASAAGTVVSAMDGSGTSYWSYGLFVTIDHGGGYQTVYAHCSSLGVTVGQAVQKGQYIGAVGQTGRAFGTHCHFEVLINGQPQYYATGSYIGLG